MDRQNKKEKKERIRRNVKELMQWGSHWIYSEQEFYLLEEFLYLRQPKNHLSHGALSTLFPSAPSEWYQFNYSNIS